MKTLYKKSRQAFFDAASILSQPHSIARCSSPYWDPEKKPLTTDYLKIGNENTKKWLIISSGTVGTDLFIGSDIQTQILRMIAFDNIKLPEEVGILMIHAINSWGAAWLRPGNINNVMLDMNFYDNYSDLIKLEELDEHRKNAIEIYKFSEKIINTVGNRNILYHWLKTAYYTLKFGHRNLWESIFTCQRHKLVGLNYGGIAKQLDNIELEKYVRKLIPADASRVIHIDLQTAANQKSPYCIKTEDRDSSSTFKINGLRNNVPYWSAGIFSISCGSRRRRFLALRNENILHCKNIWIENWARDELAYIYTDKYFNHKRKKKLLNCYYPDNASWKILALENSQIVINNAIQYLSDNSQI